LRQITPTDFNTDELKENNYHELYEKFIEKNLRDLSIKNLIKNTNRNNETQPADEFSSLGNELETGGDELNSKLDDSLDKLENPNETTTITNTNKSAGKIQAINSSKLNNLLNNAQSLNNEHTKTQANNSNLINKKITPVIQDVNAPNVYKHDDVQVKNGEVHIDSTLIIGKRDDLNLKHSVRKN
jgi:hypothetical protein